HIVPVRYREPMRKAFAEFVRTDQGPLLGKTVELAALRRDGSDIAAFMIVALNQQGEITLLNRKAHAILGYEEGTLIGRNWFTTCVPPRLRAEVHSIFERLMAGDASAAERFENAVLTRTGEERIIAWHNTVLADGSGAAVGTLSSGEDVTARRRTEAALRASEGVLAERARDHLAVNRLQQDLRGPGALGEKLTKITATAVRLLDADFCRIWVTRPGDRCQSDCVHAQVCRGPDADGQRDACLHLLASSGRYVHTEGAGHRRVPLGHYKIGRIATGEVRQLWTNTVTTDPRIHDRAWAKELGLVSFAGFQLRPPGGKTIGVLAMFSKHEVTPETNALLESLANTAAQVIQTETAEQEQRRLQSQLVQAQRLESVGQLAAGIAHEINTPTQFVSDNTRFLRDAFPKLQELLGRYQQLGDACRNGAVSATLLEELERAVKKAKLDYLLKQIPEALSDSLEGLERVTKIVRAMKDFAHPGEVSMSPADLNKAIESTVTVARNEWKYVAEVKLDLDPALPAVPCLVADFNQAVLNMIVNAAHAIKDVVGDGGRGLGAITISTRLDGDQVEVRIADNGTGIPVEHRDRIFDQFYTTKEVGRGTGQGLAIARRTIVEKHHGTLTFETEVGRGTTFIIRLPVEPDGGKAEEKLDHEFAHSARR
ncbi:MAG: ATP-binding protein, partial [Planctomycetota bacterium]